MSLPGRVIPISRDTKPRPRGRPPKDAALRSSEAALHYWLHEKMFRSAMLAPLPPRYSPQGKTTSIIY